MYNSYTCIVGINKYKLKIIHSSGFKSRSNKLCHLCTITFSGVDCLVVLPQGAKVYLISKVGEALFVVYIHHRVANV